MQADREAGRGVLSSHRKAQSMLGRHALTWAVDIRQQDRRSVAFFFLDFRKCLKAEKEIFVSFYRKTEMLAEL